MRVAPFARVLSSRKCDTTRPGNVRLNLKSCFFADFFALRVRQLTQHMSSQDLRVVNPILRAYAALIPANTLQLPAKWAFDELHHFLFHSILLDPHLQCYSPSVVYKRSFWKWAIEMLESIASHEACVVNPLIYLHACPSDFPGTSKDDEVDLRIYTHYLSLVADLVE